jgi:hypothetical protein
MVPRERLNVLMASGSDIFSHGEQNLGRIFIVGV